MISLNCNTKIPQLDFYVGRENIKGPAQMKIQEKIEFISSNAGISRKRYMMSQSADT